MKIVRFNSKKLDKVYNRAFLRNRRVEEKVKTIIDDVRLFGDEAVVKYTKKFDKVKLSWCGFGFTLSTAEGLRASLRNGCHFLRQ